jgi:MYXO-CTERM domain-containing protein
VCCNTSCAGQCQACNLANQVGTCSFVVGEPVAPRPPCAGVPPCQGACAGGSDVCAYPGAGVSCAPASCTGDVATPAASCDGTGQCAGVTTTPCNPYACDATTGACKVACVSDTDCSQGSVCDTTSGKCATATATCADAFTVALPNGQEQSCEPYRCVAGKCQQQCSTTADCAPGFECQQPVCVPIAATDAGTDAAGGSGGGAAESSDSSGGCGCSLPGGASGSRGWPLLLALGLERAWRRRRRRVNGAQ